MMSIPNIPFETRKIEAAVDFVQRFYRQEKGIECSREIIATCVSNWLSGRIEDMVDDLSVTLTELFPHATNFQSQLEAEVRRSEAKLAVSPILIPILEKVDVYSGFLMHSPTKLAAMVSYFASKGLELYKTKLNKLLYYADMTYFSHFDASISGTAYLHFEQGPVPYRGDEFFEKLEKDGTIRTSIVHGIGRNVRSISSGNNRIDVDAVLTLDEIKGLNWVVKQYGNLSSSEIRDLSHEELGYKNTPNGKPIAYRFAKFLINLPPKDYWT
jgi:uncharacterized phage-associated protein